MAVATPDVAGAEDSELDERALTEYMAVLEDATDCTRRAPGLYSVTTQSGREYLVDAELPACECPDHEYRDWICKHIRRVQFATGRREIPAWINGDAVDNQLGMHIADEQEGDS